MSVTDEDYSRNALDIYVFIGKLSLTLVWLASGQYRYAIVWIPIKRNMYICQEKYWSESIHIRKIKTNDRGLPTNNIKCHITQENKRNTIIEACRYTRDEDSDSCKSNYHIYDDDHYTPLIKLQRHVVQIY